MKKLLLTGLLLAISACGGGGSSDSASINTMQAETSSAIQSTSSLITAYDNNQSYFNESKNSFPDLKFYYDSLCGNKTQLGHFLVLDLNNDGYKDIVFSLWCDLNGYSPNLYGTNYTGEIPNTLMVLYQKTDNSFYVANEEIFGKKIVNIGGPGIAVYGDFNNDGKNDIFFAIAKEDGRAYVQYSDNTTSWDATPYALMSNKNTFELQRLPYSFVNNFAKVIKGLTNNDEVVVGGRNLKFSNGGWEITQNYNWVSRSAINYSLNNTNYIFSDLFNETEFGISLYKQSLESWILNSKNVFAVPKKAKVLEPNSMTYSYQNFIVLKDIIWLIPSFSESCIIEKNNLSTSFVIIFEGLKLDSYNNELLIMPNNSQNILPEGKQLSWSNYVMRLLKVKIENENIVAYDWIDGEYQQLSGIRCTDINNDQTIDISLLKWGVDYKPIVYTNNSTMMNKIDQKKFPELPQEYDSGSSYLVDINGDGKQDVIYAPGNYKSNILEYKFKIYFGDATLN